MALGPRSMETFPAARVGSTINSSANSSLGSASQATSTSAVFVPELGRSASQIFEAGATCVDALRVIAGRTLVRTIPSSHQPGHAFVVS